MKRLLAVLCAFLIGAPAYAGPPAIPPSAPFSNANATPCVYNWTPASLPKWRKALANQQNGLGTAGAARILFLGDSLAKGIGAGTDGAGLVNGLLYSRSANVAKKLSGVGITTKQSSFLGQGGTIFSAATIKTFNPYLTFTTADWSVAVANGIPGGGWFQESSSATSSLVFSPPEAWDTAIIYYSTNNTGLATFSATINDGTTPTSINTNVAVSFGATTITANTGAGVHTLSIARTSGGALYFNGALLYDSTNRGTVQVINAGASGSYSADFLSTAQSGNPYNIYNAIPTLAPSLTEFILGGNDANTGVSVATFTANMQTIITKLLATGDVILHVESPFQTTTGGSAQISLATQQAYNAAIIGLGYANGIPVVDDTCRLTSWPVSNAAGEQYDSLHLNNIGYGDVADVDYRVLVTP